LNPDDTLRGRLEALILASDEPLSIQRMAGLLANDIASGDIRAALLALETHYSQRGIHLIQIAGGWQFRTAAEHADLVRRLWQVRPVRLSRSALETLAIIAYRQPTTRAEIEALRGVKTSSGIIATLQERGWIKVLGRKDVPGRPHLYGTGRQFLVDFGLNTLKDLPESSQLLDEDELRQLDLNHSQANRNEHELTAENNEKTTEAQPEQAQGSAETA